LAERYQRIGLRGKKCRFSLQSHHPSTPGEANENNIFEI